MTCAATVFLVRDEANNRVLDNRTLAVYPVGMQPRGYRSVSANIRFVYFTQITPRLDSYFTGLHDGSRFHRMDACDKACSDTAFDYALFGNAR